MTTLGQLIALVHDRQRDAIHVAVAPAKAAELLLPGDHVGFLNDGTGTVGRTDSTVGVVDPFLKEPVPPGAWFWLCLYPNSVTSLRHEWTHPAFTGGAVPKTVVDVNPSMQWLKDYAEAVGVSYQVLMDAAHEALAYGNHFCLPYDTPNVVYEKKDAFWGHYEAVTGTHVHQDKKEHPVFSCAC